ncbi:MAG: hypothetical protein HONBIEJF_02068 [Fimbriimonadaceae bacterium]|nr:hypothetical protein [Fimbriimonadaceae bacterium]
MRAVVGVDVRNAFWPVANLLQALRFPDCEIDLVHAIEPVLPDGTFPELSQANAVAELLELAKSQGESVLQDAEARLTAAGVTARSFQRYGDVARQMIEHADEVHADLLCARTETKSYYGSLFLGSVAKGLVVGAHQSVLIAKHDCDPARKLTAVFATDHSPYATRCLDLLLKLAPKGIEKFIVVTANEITPGLAALLVNDVPAMQDKAPAWIAEKLHEYNEAICRKLQALSPQCGSQVIEGHPNVAIKKAMAESSADLLIMGAQGHGFFERLRLGSKSFHQAMNEPHSILILRPPGT